MDWRTPSEADPNPNLFQVQQQADTLSSSKSMLISADEEESFSMLSSSLFHLASAFTPTEAQNARLR